MKELKSASIIAGEEQFVIPQEVAIAEVKSFVEYHLDKKVTNEDIENGYEETVRAVMRGLLNISEAKSPILTLKEPIKDEDGAIAHDSIPFITRIKPTTMASLQRGIDLTKEQLKYVNVMTAYLTQIGSVAMLDKLGKFDYKVIQQVTGLFS